MNTYETNVAIVLKKLNEVEYEQRVRDDEKSKGRKAKLFFSASIGDAVLPYWIETDIFSYSVTDFSAPLLNAAVNVVVFPFLRGLPFNIIIFLLIYQPLFLYAFCESDSLFATVRFFNITNI